MAQPQEERGWIVALEGSDEMVSSQLQLLPDSSSILKMPDLSRRLRRARPQHGEQFDTRDFAWKAHMALKDRYTEARRFLAEGNPDGTPIVFMHGGAIAAQRACLSMIREFVPEVRGDLLLAEEYLNEQVKNGVYGLLEPRQPRRRNVAQDPYSRAMRDAEELDARTAYLQQVSPAQLLDDPTVPANEEGVEIGTNPEVSSVVDTKDFESADPPISRFSVSDVPAEPATPATPGTPATPAGEHDSSHLSTAKQVMLRQFHIVGVHLEERGHGRQIQGSTSEPSSNASGHPSSATTIRARREAKRHEALLLLRGEAKPEVPFEPVLPRIEDVVFLFSEEDSSITLEELMGLHEKGQFPIHGPGTTPQVPADNAHRFLMLLVSENQTSAEVQNDVRLQLKSWFETHHPGHDFSLLDPVQERRNILETSEKALSDISQHADLCLAVGAHDSVNRDRREAVVDDLVKLGQPDGKDNRSGRVSLNLLISKVMVAHTSLPLSQQTENPFDDSSKMAELLLPHIAAHLSSNPTTRFLVISLPQRNLPIVLALQQILGRDFLKIAAVVNNELPPPVTSSEPSLFNADFVISHTASRPEMLALKTKIWKVLVAADVWYKHGRSDDEGSEDDETKEKGKAADRTSIAVTTEDVAAAPAVTDRMSTVKKPQGFDINAPMFHLPFVRGQQAAAPESPPESIPASSPGYPPPQPALPSSSATAPPPPPSSGGPAPASPEPTIGSSGSGSSVGTWKARLGLDKLTRRAGTPPARSSSSRSVTKKFSALFRHTKASGQGKNTSPPSVASTITTTQGPATPSHQAPALSPPLPPAPDLHTSRLAAAADDAGGMKDHDDNVDDHAVDTDKEEEGLGGYGRKKRRPSDPDTSKARKVLGLE
jgi:hypothetical protein